MRGDLLLCNTVDGKLQLKHASAAKKKVTGTRIIKEVERYVEWSCVLNCLCYHPYLVSMLFADLLSLHLIIFLMLFILVNICERI